MAEREREHGRGFQLLCPQGHKPTSGLGRGNLLATKKLEDLLAIARVPPADNQMECHPAGWQQARLRKLCESKNVHLSAYSPLGGSNVLTNPVGTTVAEKLGKTTPAQVALRWGLQMGQSVLPKSTRESRIKENFDIFDWSIPEELFAKFSDIEQASTHFVFEVPCN
ncbi:NADPH-dependent aldo-keto reductase, chloroplastic-like [Phoenix dactylifera]|uniref:NADPH-dependent aldo-keto reductase, chloroplastic-like n=1 Tax=Phoenix dactylifera TaxID=42345 RepID=A0A8B9A0A3_PHODC|nr:NADPH-dependent aldo-keto reductase, chloroplastic-like [Phoenix dactylifera]